MMNECRRQFGIMREGFRRQGMNEQDIADPYRQLSGDYLSAGDFNGDGIADSADGCPIDHEALEPDTHVRIVDIVRVNAGENFRAASLGHIRCRDRRQFSP